MARLALRALHVVSIVIGFKGNQPAPDTDPGIHIQCRAHKRAVPTCTWILPHDARGSDVLWVELNDKPLVSHEVQHPPRPTACIVLDSQHDIG